MRTEMLIVLLLVIDYVVYIACRARLVQVIRLEFSEDYEALGKPNAFNDAFMVGIPIDRLCHRISRQSPLWGDARIRQLVSGIIWCQIVGATLVLLALAWLLHRLIAG